MDRETLAREDVHHCQGSEDAAALQRVLDEVHAPALVGTRRSIWHDAQVASALFPLLGSYAQAFLPVETKDALVIHPPALAHEKDVDAPVAKAAPRLGNLTDSQTKCGHVLLPAPVVVACAILAHEPAGTACGDFEALDEPTHARLPCRGLQDFFARTS
jgi:hypothetical protein